MTATADRIADARAQLEAFGDEAQEYMDKLIAGLQAQYDQFVGGIGGDPSQSPSLGADSAQNTGAIDFSSEGSEGVGGSGSSDKGAVGGDFGAGDPLGRVAATSLKGLLTGRSATSILNGGATSLEKLLGQSLGAGLTGSSAGFRLSGSQSALEQAIGLQQGEKNS